MKIGKKVIQKIQNSEINENDSKKLKMQKF